MLISGDYHGNLIWWRGEAFETRSQNGPSRRTKAGCGPLPLARTARWSPVAGTITRSSCGTQPTATPIRTLEGHTSHVYNVAFHPGRHAARVVRSQRRGEGLESENGYRATASSTRKALWKYDTGFMADIGGAGRCNSRLTDTRLACAGITNVSNAFAGVGNPAVVVFDWKDGKSKLLKPKDAFQGTAWGVAFHPAGFVIAAGGGSGGGVWFWQGDDLASMHFIKLPTSARDMALAPGGDRFACAGSNGTVYLYTFKPGPAPAKPEPKKLKKK